MSKSLILNAEGCVTMPGVNRIHRARGVADMRCGGAGRCSLFDRTHLPKYSHCERNESASIGVNAVDFPFVINLLHDDDPLLLLAVGMQVEEHLIVGEGFTF